ncbi:guanylyl cyclase 1 isoform X2 [Diospyros lotus]|uniref:guanylyl cyclase 1 isoform X2 n=1 Tax=Diospyros lotus TaxID=55363 RepID=UPI0022512F3E|nr:guanylyl cyclase 1 isoform X2 [Diospyros lotus]
MWPLHLLLNKFLKAEEEKDQGSDGCPLTEAEACPVGDLLSNKRCNDAVLPESYLVEVPLISQQHSWDCGLACVLMVLRTLGILNCNMQDLEELCCTTSIWTVDLAYLLQKFSVSFSYFTVTLGANPNFSVETFYKCKSISKEEISLLILSGKYVAIALVDQYKLSRSWLEEVCVSGFNSGNSGYSGHYVVICGYDAMTDEFEIRDPASSREHEKITSNRLEEARKSFGTDEDLLLVSLQESQNQERQSIGYYLYRNFCLIVKDKTFWTLHERSRNLLVESPRMGQDWGWGL